MNRKRRGYKEDQPTEWPHPRPPRGGEERRAKKKVRETARAPKPTRAT